MRLIADDITAELLYDFSASDTALTVRPGQGAQFQKVLPKTGADHCLLTLEDPTGDLEVVRLDDVQGDVLTLKRAQDGTTAKVFPKGSLIELRVTASLLRLFYQRHSDRIDAEDTPIQFRRLTAPHEGPASLLPGELAVNILTGELWVGDAASRPIEVSGGGGGGGASSKLTQPNHGLKVGDVVRWTGAQIVKAQADAIEHAGTHVVSALYDEDLLAVTAFGKVNYTSAQFVPGKVYYTSPTEPGKLTAERPSGWGQVINPMGLALWSSQLLVMPYAPAVVPSPTQNTVIVVEQPGHCLTDADIGAPFAFDGKDWLPATAGMLDDPTPHAVGLLAKCQPDFLHIAVAGRVDDASPAVSEHGFKPGEIYYVHPTQPGKLTTSPPDRPGTVSAPIAIPIHEKGRPSLLVLPWRPLTKALGNPESTDYVHNGPHSFTSVMVGYAVANVNGAWRLANAAMDMGPLGVLKVVDPDYFVVALPGSRVSVKDFGAPGLRYISNAPNADGLLFDTPTLHYGHIKSPVGQVLHDGSFVVTPWPWVRHDYNQSSVDIRAIFPAHGYTTDDIGTPMHWDGSTLNKLGTDQSMTADVLILKDVIDDAWLVLTQSGIVHDISPTVNGGVPLTPGAYYFASRDAAGQITTSRPPQTPLTVSAPLMRAVAADAALVLPFRSYDTEKFSQYGALTYVAVAGQQEFITTVPDIYGQIYDFEPRLDHDTAVDVHLNGVKLVWDDGTTNGDYTVDLDTDTVRLNVPLKDGRCRADRDAGARRQSPARQCPAVPPDRHRHQLDRLDTRRPSADGAGHAGRSAHQVPGPPRSPL